MTPAMIQHAWAGSDATRVALARTTMSGFVSYVMRDETTGLPLQMAPVHRAWHSAAEDNKNLLVWAHIESGKSTQLSVARTLWLLGRDPTLRVAIVSNTAGQSEKLLKAITRYIETSNALHKVFPDLRPADPWTHSKIAVRRPFISKDPSVQAIGIHGNILGARLDLVILDDILDYENTRTASGREDTWGWLTSSVFSRLTARGRILCVGTAFHPDDALHRMARMPGFKAYRYPVLDDTGQPRWPQKWPMPRIEEAKVRLGPLEFARQLMCVARSDEDSRFKQEWINLALKNGEGRDLAHSLAALPSGYRTYTGVDLAVQRKDGADLTSLFTIAVDPNQNRHVLWVEAGRFTGPTIIEKIVEHHQRYFSVCVVENNACFPSGTRVLTRGGYKLIEQMQPGDEVWTHQARWRRVLKRTSREFDGELVELRAAGCMPVLATPNHAFWVRQGGRVLGPRSGPDTGKYRPAGAPQWASVATLPIGESWDGSYVASALPRWETLAPTVQVEKNGAFRELEVSNDLAFFMGLFLADGTASELNSQVTFRLGESKQHAFGLLRAVAGGVFNATVTEFEDKGQDSLTLCINSVEARRLCRRMYSTPGQKRLPWEWMGWPLELRMSIVRGWLFGDGSLEHSVQTGLPHLKAQTVSRDLMLQMRSTLFEAGLRPAIRVARKAGVQSLPGGRSGLCQESYQLTLTGHDTLNLVASGMTEIERVRWAHMSQKAPSRKNQGMHVEDGHGWAKVKTLVHSPYQGPVHNLVVEEDESYTVEDFVAHNSQDYIVQFARGQFAVPIIPFTTGRNKAHPEFGVESLAAEMAGGKWIIPSRGGRPTHPEVNAWIQEMLFYSPQSHTGDRLMSSWFAREGCRIGDQSKVKVGAIDVMSR